MRAFGPESSSLSAGASDSPSVQSVFQEPNLFLYQPALDSWSLQSQCFFFSEHQSFQPEALHAYLRTASTRDPRYDTSNSPSRGRTSKLLSWPPSETARGQRHLLPPGIPAPGLTVRENLRLRLWRLLPRAPYARPRERTKSSSRTHREPLAACPHTARHAFSTRAAPRSRLLAHNARWAPNAAASVHVPPRRLNTAADRRTPGSPSRGLHFATRARC